MQFIYFSFFTNTLQIQPFYKGQAINYQLHWHPVQIYKLVDRLSHSWFWYYPDILGKKKIVEMQFEVGNAKWPKFI
jgi:hypothetical protein